MGQNPKKRRHLGLKWHHKAPVLSRTGVQTQVKSDSGLNRQDVGVVPSGRGGHLKKVTRFLRLSILRKIGALLLKYWSTDIYGFGNDSVWHF